MSPTRPLTALPSRLPALLAATLVAGSLAGCAAGLHDSTSGERSTPYVAGAAVGTMKVRDVVVTVADSSASASPTESPSPGTSGDNGQTEGFLTLVLVNAGTTADSITGVQVAGGGSVTPTDASASGTVQPGHPLVFGEASDGSSTPSSQLAISGLSQPLVPGTTVAVTISFQNAGQVTVQAPVVSAA